MEDFVSVDVITCLCCFFTGSC